MKTKIAIFERRSRGQQGRSGQGEKPVHVGSRKWPGTRAASLHKSLKPSRRLCNGNQTHPGVLNSIQLEVLPDTAKGVLRVASGFAKMTSSGKSSQNSLDKTSVPRSM